MIRLHVGDEQVIQLPATQRVSDVFEENFINSLVAGIKQHCFFIEKKIGVITDAIRNTVNTLKEGKAAVIGTDPDQIVLNFTCAMHKSSFPSAKERTVQLASYYIIDQKDNQQADLLCAAPGIRRSFFRCASRFSLAFSGASMYYKKDIFPKEADTMAEKKFAGVNGAVDTVEVNADFEQAKVFDKLRVGDLGVFFRDGLKTRFIPYDYIDRAFIRVQETRGRMCCGQANWYYYRVVFVHEGKEFADYMSEKEKDMDDALAAIAAHGVTTGFVKPEATA